MTECERLIKEGIFTKEFFKPETICDFYVDEKRKKIWALGIDLLIQFDAVCRKHNLQYSLAFGSLLGLVRHNGFIPWDDDIDVVMPRADYEKLKDYKSEFKKPLFLQYPGEDKDYYFSFAKLRNSNTTSISWPFRYETFNQGCFLDIFPLDNYQSDNIERNVEKITNLIAECSALMRRNNPNPDEIDREKLSQFPVIRDGKNIIKDLDKVLQQYDHEYSPKYIAWCCMAYHYERMTFDKDLFDDLIEKDFYGHKVFIPRKYDEVLQITYGDYMKLPPVEQRGTWHNKSVFEPDIPYEKSLTRLRNMDKTCCS